MAGTRRDIWLKIMKKAFLTLLFAVTVVGVFNVQPAHAYTRSDSEVAHCFKSFLGLPRWYDYLEVDAECRVTGPSETTIDNRGTEEKDDDTERTGLVMSKVVTRVALAVIDILMRVGGMVAFGFIVYSGFRFVMSAGNPDQEKAARETAINALIGMVITIFAIAIVTYIGKRLASS